MHPLDSRRPALLVPCLRALVVGATAALGLVGCGLALSERDAVPPPRGVVAAAPRVGSQDQREPQQGASSLASSPGESAGEQVAEAERCLERERIVTVQLFALAEVARAPEVVPSARRDERMATLEAERRTWRSRAIEAFEAAVAAGPADAGPRRDVSLIRLARLLREAGDARRSVHHLEDLVGRHPGSELAPDAHAMLAEIAFAEERLEDAVTASDAALASPRLRLRLSALYLRAWALRGLAERAAASGDRAQHAARIRAAIESLAEIVAWNARSKPSASPIAAAAELELCDLYARHGHEAEAEELFARLNASDAERLRALLEQRRRQGADGARKPRRPRTTTSL